jgi:hypothetical protein
MLGELLCQWLLRLSLEGACPGRCKAKNVLCRIGGLGVTKKPCSPKTGEADIMIHLAKLFSKWQITTGCARRALALHADRNVALVFLGFFALALLLPLLQTIYPIFGNIVTPLEERRALSPFPSLRLLLGTTGDFVAALNSWFDDRVGFRDSFIRTKNQIDYTFFRTSKKVYIGVDGWLFNHQEAVDPFSKLNDDDLLVLEQSYADLARRLRAKGIYLIVVGYPTKLAIYPEMAPADLRSAAHNDRYDKFRRYLSNRSDMKFIDAERVLKQEKVRTSEHLYYQTDMHATPVADIPIVKQIVSIIAQSENRPDIHWDEHFTIEHDGGFDGSETRFLSLLSPPKEEVPYLVGSYKIGGAETDGHWFVPDPHILERADDGNGRAFDWEFRSLPELCPRRLPGMVLFGNSFSDFFWYVGLHRYFCFIRRARNPISRFKLFFDAIPQGTKYFIFQYYEPWVVVDAPPPD